MRVLMFGPWPIARPRHGGQIRADQIVAAYRSRGHDVTFAGIVDPGSVPPSEMGPDDVAIDHRVMEFIGRAGGHLHISLWKAFAQIPEHFSCFVRLVHQVRPDVVQIEEPYLWPVVKKLLRDRYLDDVRVVHSSYNFETDHQRDLASIKGPVEEHFLSYVAETEREIAAVSDLVVTVSDGDAACFRAIGAANVVIAPNGCRQITTIRDAVRAVDAYFGTQRFALFVSSAHLPNVQGLLDLTRVPVESVPGRLVICGSVCTLLNEHRSANALIRHARFMGIVDVDLLNALLSRAAVVLLPKTRGGGSNLKTAEALLSYRPIVATTQAFAGFESRRNAPGVTVADEPVAFWRQVRWHLANPVPNVTDSWIAQREGLLWEHCLEPMVREVERLVSTARCPQRSPDSGHHRELRTS
jgi:hypothetical protein